MKNKQGRKSAAKMGEKKMEFGMICHLIFSG